MSSRRLLSSLDVGLPIAWIAFTIVVIVGRDTDELAAYLFGVLAGVMAARLIVELAFRKGTLVRRRPGVIVVDFGPVLRALKTAAKTRRDFEANLEAAQRAGDVPAEELRSFSSRLHEAAELKRKEGER